MAPGNPTLLFGIAMDLPVNRRALLGGLVTVTTANLVAGNTPALAATYRGDAAPLSFVVIGDWGRGTQAQHEVAAAMGVAAAATKASFVLALGDNFYQSGVASVDDPLWKTVYEDVYTHPALNVPWHVALGNHDYRGNPQAQVDYTARHTRWSMPARYYQVADKALKAADVDMFVIDTSPFVTDYRSKSDSQIAQNVAGQDTAAQLAWLDGALGASRARWKLVVGHHTIHSGGSQHGDTPELVARLKPLLIRHKVQAYIAGHDHDLQHIRRDGLDIVQCGAGMEARPVKDVEGTRFCVAEPGFATVDVNRDTLTFTFRDHAGAPLYRGSIAVGQAAVAA